MTKAQAKRFAVLGSKSYAELRELFAAAVARRDVAEACLCSGLLASCADGQHAARSAAVLELA